MLFAANCSTPPARDHATVEAARTLAGDNATYTCNNNYTTKMMGSSVDVPCNVDGNWGDPPPCVGRSILSFFIVSI